MSRRRDQLRIPAVVRLKRHPWSVIRGHGPNYKKGDLGGCEAEAREIYISPQHPSEREREKTLIHEILHALWPHRCKFPDCGDDCPDCKEEERVIRKLEGPLRDLIASGQLGAD